MKSEDLAQALINLLDSAGGENIDKIEFRITNRGGFEIEYGAEYMAPELNFEILMGLSEMFGTKEIDVDDYSISGCETCDWGSDYGHTIQIYNPTKLVEEMRELCKSNRIQ